MSSDCYRGCFCDDGYIQTRAGVCIPEADCAPAGESKSKSKENSKRVTITLALDQPSRRFSGQKWPVFAMSLDN